MRKSGLSQGWQSLYAQFSYYVLHLDDYVTSSGQRDLNSLLGRFLGKLLLTSKRRKTLALLPPLPLPALNAAMMIGAAVTTQEKDQWNCSLCE